MQKLRILSGILKRTKADRIILSFIIFFFLDALFILIVEPGLNNYGDALWYCYAVLSTVGFGDIVITTFLGKLASVILTVYSLVVIAIFTGVIVNFYTQVIQNHQKNTLAAFADKLEHLPELSKEELHELSKDIKKFRDTMPDRK